MTAAAYLFTHFFYRIFEFIEHWHYGSFKIASHLLISFLGKLDRTFAFKITLKNLFQPLYGDRSFIGYVLGFCFRSLRIFSGAIIYCCIIIFASAIYVVWLIILPYIIYKILFFTFQ